MTFSDAKIDLEASHPSIILMSLLCGLSLLPLNIFLPSLPAMSADLATNYGVIGLSLAGYTAASVFFEMISGPLSDRYGRRPVLLICLGIFIVGSIGCAFASNIWAFLAARLLQAPITSAYPLSMASIRDTSKKELAASRIGYVAMMAAIAPLVGPTIGGLIDQSFGWRTIFWFLAAAGSASFLWCAVRLNETSRNSKQTFCEQLKTYLSLLTVPLFWSYSLCMAFSVGAFYALMAGAPLAAKAAFGIQPATLGMYIGAVTGGYILGSFVSGKRAKFYSLPTMILCGRVIALSGPALSLTLLGLGFNHPLAVFGPCILIGFGNGMTSPSANAGVMSIRAGFAGSAAGLAGAVTIGGGAIFSSFTAAAISEKNVVVMTLSIMLGATLLALAAGLWASFTSNEKTDSRN